MILDGTDSTQVRRQVRDGQNAATSCGGDGIADGTDCGGGFTLVEVLVVVAITAILMGILMPTLMLAKTQARQAVCRGNLRQLLMANLAYSTEHDGCFVPAARDMWDGAGLWRWHGYRPTRDAAFVSSQGPLAGYLGDGQVKRCAENVEFAATDRWTGSFEKGCGGYGYNMVYIGSRMWHKPLSGAGWWRQMYERTTRADEVRRPAETLMFADSAISQEAGVVIEYSFAEPPFAVFEGTVMTGFYMSPSIHFRHRGRANIGWGDGHTDSREPAPMPGDNVYGVDSAAMGLGWFGPVDNTLFDLE